MNLRFSALLILSFIIAGCGGGGGNSSSTDVTPGNNNTTMGGCFTSFTTVGGPNTTISGKIQYEDKEYGIGGFTGKTTYKAVRYAEVDIVNSGNSNVIDSVFTNSSGIYHIPPTTFTNGTSVYFRVNSYTSGNINGKPDVVVGSTTGTPYGVACDSNFKPQTGTLVTANLYIPTSSPAAGAFNIMDIFTSAGEFIKSLAGTNPPPLKGFWQTGNLNGTNYCTGAGCSSGDGIYVLSETGGDTDEYDDDVLWHEYGHFIAQNFSRDDSQGGDHFIGDNTLDLRLAWSEGWGEFFPSAVKKWLNANNPSLLSIPNAANISKYVDSPLGAFFDLAFPGGNLYSSNEVSVGAVLWDSMNDPTAGMAGIWDVFDYINATLSPVSLETFWDVWQTRQSAILTPYFNDRQIFYQADEFEKFNDYIASSSRKYTGLPETHYLYDRADLDFIAFNATGGMSYTIETYDLKNGADTYLRLLDTNGSTILSWNDNWNNVSYAGCTNCPINGTDLPGIPIAPLSSKIVSPILTPGTYYVKVNASPSKPPSAGRYGTYTLRITTP